MKLFMKFFCLAAILFGSFLLNETVTMVKAESKNTNMKKTLKLSNEAPVKIDKIFIAVEPGTEKVQDAQPDWRQIDIKDVLGGNGDNVLEQGEEIEVVDVEAEFIRIKAEGKNRADEEVQAIIRRVHLAQGLTVTITENQFGSR